MKILKCILADDEPIARQILEGYISELPNLELIASFKNAFEVMGFLQNNEADILFLDINMPKLSGMSLLKSLKNTPNVIITTAYPEFAIEGFELSVTDYLLKPFSFERFLQAILKVSDQNLSRETSGIIPGKESKSDHIFIKSDKKIIKVDLEKIFYIEAYGNYLKLYTDLMILTPSTLSDFLGKLPENFIRIHKSYAVNFNKIKFIDGNQLILENDSKLPIGKSYKKSILNKIENN